MLTTLPCYTYISMCSLGNMHVSFVLEGVAPGASLDGEVNSPPKVHSFRDMPNITRTKTLCRLLSEAPLDRTSHLDSVS